MLQIFTRAYGWTNVLGVFEGKDKGNVPYTKYKISDPDNKFSDRVNNVFLIYSEGTEKPTLREI